MCKLYRFTVLVAVFCCGVLSATLVAGHHAAKPVMPPSVGASIETYIKPSVMTPRRDGSERKVSPSASLSLEDVTQPLFGSLIGYYDENQELELGLVQVPLDKDEIYNVTGGITAQFGGVAIGDVYWAINNKIVDGNLLASIASYSLLTGEQLSQRDAAPSLLAFDLALNPTDGKVYGCFFSNDTRSFEFGVLNPTTAQRTTIKSIEIPWNSCAFDSEGVLWVLDKLGDFYSVDPATGEMSFIGASGFKPQYMSSAAIEAASGRFFTTISPIDGTGLLVEIDKATGKGTLVRNFSRAEEITGLYFYGEAVADGAPAEVASLSANFVDGNMSGTIDFMLPTATKGGAALPTDDVIDYNVEIDNVVAASGSAKPGEKMSVKIEVAASGKHFFGVRCSNDVGKGVASYVSHFVGNGTPVSPAEASLTIDGLKASISWSAVTESKDGGFINPAAVTYTLVRMPDETVVASDIKDCSASDRIVVDKLSEIYYMVSAQFEGKSSSAVETNRKLVGDAEAPYHVTFDAAHRAENWTIIDANGDGKTWRYFGNAFFDDCQGEAKGYDDDWLVSVPIKLEAGKYYTFDALMFSTNIPTHMHEFEVKYGMAPTVSAMTSTCIKPTVFQEAFDKRVSGEIVPEQTGNYYIGIHAITKGEGVRIGVKEVNLDAGRSIDVPAKVAELKAVAGDNFTMSAAVTVTAPTATRGGATLKALTAVKLARNGAVVRTFESPKPGATLTFIDDAVAVNGINTYSAYAVNESGEGSAVEADVFVGIHAPAPATQVVMTPIKADPGMVTLTWEAPTVDVDGTTIPANRVRYRVVALDEKSTVVADGIEATSLTYKAAEASQRGLVGALVYAMTDGGSAQAAPSNIVFVGTPYETPLLESFADGRTQIDMMFDPLSTNGTVRLNTDKTAEITSADGDNGFVEFSGVYPGDMAVTLMGPVTLPAKNAVISFSVYGIEVLSGGRGGMVVNTNDIAVEVFDGSQWKELSKWVVGNLPDGTWATCLTQLSDYAGQTVELRIKATKNSYGYGSTYFDRIYIGSMPSHGLTLASVSAPQAVRMGVNVPISATIANSGLNEMTNVKVELYADGEFVVAKSVASLKQNESTVVKFVAKAPAAGVDKVDYKIKAVSAADETHDDNELSTSVAVAYHEYPLPTGLAARVGDNGVVELNWDAPLLASDAKTVKETMEKALPFETSLDGWTFVDMDKRPILTIQGVEMPGVVGGTSKLSFIVTDFDAMNRYEVFKAASGRRAIASMPCLNGVKKDDWAITPMLSGRAQTITFMAKSLMNDFLETVEMLYSTSTTDISAFKSIRVVSGVPTTWSRLQASLPEGARYFAIRCVTQGGAMLMVDDVTMELAGESEAMKIDGYKVRRNGQFVATTKELNYRDAMPGEGSHDYRVSAIYNYGESRPTEAANVTITRAGGANSVSNGDVAIQSSCGQITVSALQPVDVVVYDAAGAMVFASPDVETIAITVHPGVYIIKAGSVTKKINVL